MAILRKRHVGPFSAKRKPSIGGPTRRRKTVLVGALASASLGLFSSACTALYDPDDLVASLRQDDSTQPPFDFDVETPITDTSPRPDATTPDVPEPQPDADTSTPDVPVLEDISPPNDTVVVADTDAPDTVTPPTDTVLVADTAPDVGPTDTVIADTAPTDTVSPPDVTPPTDTVVADVGPTDTASPDVAPPIDTTPTPQLVVRHSGEDGCTFDYYRQLVTNCPKACSWTISVDALDSTGVDSVSWNFAVGGDYIVTPATATGLEASFSIGLPSCQILSGNAVNGATVTIRASAAGVPATSVTTFDFGTRLVFACDGDPLSECPAP